MSDRFDAAELNRFATALFAAAGMPADRAEVVARYLVEADLMGHDTHGLNLAPGYLNALLNGAMPADGEPEVVSDTGAAAAWDGRYLSGVWLTWKGMQTGFERARRYGSFTLAIRRSHHIACLAAYLPDAAEHDLMMILASSDPANGGVAPFGAVEGVYTPNPIAAAIPTTGDPILIDVSASTTTHGLTGRLKARGERFPGKWMIDSSGAATDDPAVVDADPPGALLPLGGLDRGHKGFALGLLVEALTSGLGGFGRKDSPDSWGASVFLQVLDPKAFGGLPDFKAETGWLSEACRAAAVPPGQPPVRLPGDGALARRRAAVSDGVVLYESIMNDLAPLAERLAVPLPKPLA